ncbi:hypothetical protein [Brevibacillus nitrificans]|uniref:hypothetical protein n=1 Tax=Brevibacillus nitrificans TaxID=651560 RepID=UPI002630C600|nr:hypothetical protein [Brevibacillus nitrificans]
MPPTIPIKENEQNLEPTPPPLFPGSLQEVCIRAPRVYDWILSGNWHRYQICVPDPCKDVLQEALCAGREVYVRCLDPFSPEHAGALSIRVLPPIRRTVIQVNGCTAPVGVIRTSLELCASILVFADCELLFDFTTPLLLQDELVVSLPESLNESDICCRVATGECLPFTGFLHHNVIELELLVCTEIIVEACSTLEILAKPCLPRTNLIPVPPRSITQGCPPFHTPLCTKKLGCSKP